MTPSARLAATLDLLTLIDETPRPADSLVSGYFRARRFIGSKDRAFISSETYDILRHQARLNWWLTYLGQPITARNRFLTYLKLFEKKTQNEIDGLCDGGQYAPARLEPEEKKLIASLKGHTATHPNMPEEVVGECPEWASEGLKKRFGKNLSKHLDVLLRPAPLDLRINPLKTTREKAAANLMHLGLDVGVTPYSPWGLRIHNRPALGQITMLKEGALEIQDEGSQLVALLVDAKPGERVVDFCAGAGGKTLAISAQMQNKGRIIACDVLANRLKRSAERFRRAGLHNIETHPLTSERDPWVKRHKGAFDRVLVNAPCSGTGTWRRNPDARWKSLGPGLDALIPLQASILESASRLVKEKGRLVYATCSLLPQENEEQITRFLENHPEFKLVPVQECGAALSDLPKTGDYLSLTPAEHKTDGFFAAIMEKLPQSKNETKDISHDED
ncbi:MAG: RsmB/NOP family class I SAM-dependent RNA methyltransferase [Alphaproteobacteria bacterium]|nr:RsmB/NOP family class I SAM-dependent RNA methyltransferase [Alphaproteobacteria bacterium]